MFFPFFAFAEDVRDQLPKEGKYEFIKANSINQNLDVFKKIRVREVEEGNFLVLPK